MRGRLRGTWTIESNIARMQLDCAGGYQVVEREQDGGRWQVYHNGSGLGKASFDWCSPEDGYFDNMHDGMLAAEEDARRDLERQRRDLNAQLADIIEEHKELLRP